MTETSEISVIGIGGTRKRDRARLRALICLKILIKFLSFPLPRTPAESTYINFRSPLSTRDYFFVHAERVNYENPAGKVIVATLILPPFPDQSLSCRSSRRIYSSTSFCRAVSSR